MVQKDNGRWVRVGKQIRACRKRAGLSQDELGERIKMSPTMLSAMERGARGIKREHTERIDQALGTGGTLTDEWERSSGSGLPQWYQRAAERERAATEIREYHPLVVPGLLQTEDYAQALLRAGLPNESPAEIDDLVRARMDRQLILATERPPRLLIVLDEGVLRRPTGGRGIMSRQLDHLLSMADRTHVSIQVVPYETEYHPGLSNAFGLFTVPDQGHILYVETRRSGTPTNDSGAVNDYLGLFGDLQGAAVPPTASRQLIERIRGEFT